MDHHVTPVSTGSSGVDITALVLRLVLLLATAFLAGTGILRPLVGDLPRKLWLTVSGLGLLSAVLAAVSAATVEVNLAALIIHILLALAVPVLLRWPSAGRWVLLALVVLVVLETSLDGSGIDFAIDTVYVAAAALWFGITLLSAWVPAEQWRATQFRVGPLSVTLGGLLTLAGVVQLVLSGVGFDRRLYESLFGIALLVVVALPAVVAVLSGILLSRNGSTARVPGWRARRRRRFRRVERARGGAQPPPLPIPGVPLLADATVGGDSGARAAQPATAGAQPRALPARRR